MGNQFSSQPAFSREAIRSFVLEHYGMDGTFSSLPSDRDQNFLLNAGPAGRFVVKISNRNDSREVLDLQVEAMAHLADLGYSSKIPTVIASLSGTRMEKSVDPHGDPYWIRVMTFLEGESLARIRPRDRRTLEHLGYTLGELDRHLADFNHPAMDRELHWDLRQAEWISSYTHNIRDHRRRGIVERYLLQYRGCTSSLLPCLPMSVIYNDANDDNVLLAPDPAGGYQVVGLLDFGDLVWSHTVNELAVACAYVIFGAEDRLDIIAQVTKGYHQARPLSEAEIRVLFPLVCLRLCLSVTISAIKAIVDPHDKYGQISTQAAWQTLEQLESIAWRRAENHLRQACGFPVLADDVRIGRRLWKDHELLEERRAHIGPSLSLFYRDPLTIVKGSGQFLFDTTGKAYLDCVNNVCHVGHSHPKVVAALSRQAELLNTNTRYLHPYLVEYAQRLTATLPDPLRVCYFVNSGSEANELAVRLARTHTARQDIIVLEDAYHGNTSTLVDMSPYKCEGPSGKGLAEWAHKVVKPDPYRGPHRGAGKAVGKTYAGYIRQCSDRLAAEGRPPALVICESILGCGGQIVLPEGYLEEAFRHVRSAGGVCAVDEVQVGFGRIGTHMWAFETQNVVPDIVTLGKPMGNGHPLGAVITTPEIAASFDNGMEFFSTFGGNPVSCAVGMAVLDVIAEEGLQEQAARVGRYLRKGFLTLSERHPIIGDVRGMGLFMGVELVQDRESLAPATQETAALIELAKADGVLLSAEGPYHNVLKIKPPLQFTETDADLLLGTIDRALQDIP